VGEVKSYCHTFHTCIVESSHNACLAFAEKRVNYYSSFEGRTFCSYSKFNLGWSWIVKFYSKLGIPLSDALQTFLEKKTNTCNKNAERQKTIEYKRKQRNNNEKKKQKKVEREKKSLVKGHDYSVEKVLFDSNMNFEVKESVYHGFKSDKSLIWYRGDVVKSSISKNGKKVYDVKFDDVCTEKNMSSKVLKRTLPSNVVQYTGNKKVKHS
jgi:hypothetical protein